MKNCIKLMYALMLCTSVAYGQSFKKAFEMSLPEPLNNVQMEWIAIDSDTLLDIVITGISTDGQLKIMTFKNNLTSIQYRSTQITGFKSGFFQLRDWNGDNVVDLLVSGKTTVNTNALFLFENKGDFSFQKNSNKLIDQGSEFRIADFNSDAKQDLLFFGSNGGPLSLYENAVSGFRLAYDSANLNVRDAVVFDLNNDGIDDFVISGRDPSLTPITMSFLSRDKLRFGVTPLQNPVNGHLSAIDLNADGKVDLTAVGETTGSSSQQVWTNTGQTLAAQNTSSVPFNASLFSGDFDSDGIADVLINGKNVNGKNVNYIKSASAIISLDTMGLILQRAGDFDRDGDLDIAQLKDSLHQQWLKIVRADMTEKNEKPITPVNSFAISAFSKTFLYWEAKQDDHTATASLTYDVWLGNNNSSIITPDFNIHTGKRMTVSHGNSGTSLSKIIRGLSDGNYEYLIQSVDNAYNGSTFCRGGVIPCFDLVHEHVNSCKNQQVTLTSPDNAFWFSTTNGFQRSGKDYQFVATQNDTIFSFVPQGADCSKNKVWVVTVFDITEQTQKETLYVCEGKTVKLGIAPGWKNIEWSTPTVISGVDTIHVAPIIDQKIIVKATSTTGCPYTKEFNIRISKSQLTLNGELFRTIKGNPVQLEASGTFDHFLWEPHTGLNNPAISNPIAEPVQTTIYNVNAVDSIGCIVSREVQVQIEFTAFVPNLFTPNGDNKNDVLLIYGLGPVADFQFMIFNREGSKVFETSNTSQATSSGWNGFVNGTRQPSGVYYWKVEGSTLNGERLLLNGKKSGSILLVH